MGNAKTTERLREDLTEMGRKAGQAHERNKRVMDRMREHERSQAEGRDSIAVIMRSTGTVADGNLVIELETLGELPHGIPALKATAGTRELAEKRLRWAYAEHLMDRRRRIYVGPEASKKARDRAKSADIYIAMMGGRE